jgi:hypothetical protein
MGAGAGLLLPMFRTMLPEALGQDPDRKRIFIYAGAVSAAEGNFPTSDGSDGIVVGDSFSPLEPYRDELLFLRGLNVPWDRQQHGPDWFMTGTDGRPGGITMDRFLSREIGSKDPVGSLQLALHGCNSVNASVSADGPGQVFPAEPDPIKAYADIFGNAVMMEGTDRVAAMEQLLAERRSLLDFVRDDIGRAQTQLAGPEREKLEQYLTGLRDLEAELENFAEAQGMQDAGCSELSLPDVPRASQTASEELQSAHVEVAVNALLCGMTRVAVLHKNCSASYPWLSGIGVHNTWHSGSTEGRAPYFRYHSGNLARVRERLGEVSEGNGTVADSSLIVYFERSGIHHHDGQSDSFLLTVGSVGGYLQTGRHLTFDGHNVNDAFVSIINTMGVDTDTFGDPNLATGPLPGLAA